MKVTDRDLAVKRLQLLVDAALNNASADGVQPQTSDEEEARSLLDYDDDVFTHAADNELGVAAVADCVRSWKQSRGT